MTIAVATQPTKGIPLPQYLINQLRHFPVPDQEQELKLIRKAKRGDRYSLTWLMVANTRLVSRLAKKYASFVIDTDDLIQEGLLGVRRAVFKFEPNKGFRFSTYARHWILKFVRQFCYVNRLNQLKLPKEKQMSLDRIRKLQSEKPNSSLVEIAQLADLTLEKAQNLLLWGRNFQLKVDWQKIPYFEQLPFDEEEIFDYSAELDFRPISTLHFLFQPQDSLNCLLPRKED